VQVTVLSPDIGLLIANGFLAQEAGEREFRQCQFTSGKQSATIWAGKYRDPSSAYEVYTSLLRPGMTPSTVGRFTAVDDKGLLILSGDVVVGVDQPRNVPTKDLQELIAWLKANAPVEFFAGSMSLDLANTDKLSVFYQDARRCGVKIRSPDVNLAGADLTGAAWLSQAQLDRARVDEAARLPEALTGLNGSEENRGPSNGAHGDG